MRHTTATYNPHLLTRDDLIASFVARRPLLDELVDDLRRGGHQHHLLVGARGSGKTTLLLRLAAAIEDDKKLARTAIPLRFPEEQYNVARPSDFWLNCLDALTDALEARGDHAGKRKLESSVAAIETLSDDERTRAALDALTGWTKRAGRLLVLLVDNLGLILERLRDSQWGLREALSEDNRLVLIGATSTFLEEAAAYESPLYDFFNVHELGQLSEQDARSVVAQLATRAGAGDVQAVLDNDPGRFKALYVLTGGMPRMLALLAGVLAQDGGPAERDLEQMLDQLTPYYKARFDELPGQSQIVVDTVALHWYAITAAECAERTRLDVNVVSAQLNRLVKLGLLAKVSLAGESRLGFQLVERFFNVWYLMRASRRARQQLTWFVEFLRTFYSDEELARRAQVLLDGTPGASTWTHVLALAAAIPDVALRRRLEWRAATMLHDELRREPIREILDLNGVDAHLSPVLDRARALKALRTRLRRTPELSKQGTGILRDPLFSIAIKTALIELLQHEGSKFALKLVATQRKAKKNDELLFGDRVMTAIERGEVPSLWDITTVDEASALISLANNPEAVAFLMAAILNAKTLNMSITTFLIDSVPATVHIVLASAASAIERSEWTSARDLARQIFQRHGAESAVIEWTGAVSFFRACVQHGRATEAFELIADLGLGDRWLPLYEALRIAAGDHDRIDRLAPEVRTPTAELVKRLQLPDPKRELNPRARKPRRKMRAGKPSAP
jgi:energy-coupling factor transporter ATP-binding protein EcfA2